MTYTIEEISKAWFKFTQPKYFVKHGVVHSDVNEMIETDDLDSIKLVPVDYSRWLAYLMSEIWRNEESK